MSDSPDKEDQQGLLEEISAKLDNLAVAMEKTGIAEYVNMLHSPRRLMLVNFWAGLVRGFGMAIGFTLLAAVIVYLLQKLVGINTPLIADFIAEIIEIVQNQLNPDALKIPR